MRSAKERKHEKKRKHKALSVTRTERSRARRLSNKAKRDEIHAIDPDIKIKIVDQKIYIDDDYLVEVEVVGKKIKAIDIPEEIIDFKVTEAEKGRAIDAQIEKERLGVFNPFRWKKK